MAKGRLYVIDGRRSKLMSKKLLKNILESSPELKYGKEIILTSFKNNHNTWLSKNCYEDTERYAVTNLIHHTNNAWKHVYNNGGIVLCDGYFTSHNIIRHVSLPKRDFVKYLDWLRIKIALP